MKKRLNILCILVFIVLGLYIPQDTSLEQV